MTAQNILQANDLSYKIGANYLLKDIDFAASVATFTAIIGPNGAGKTTLLNLLDGDAKSCSGTIMLNGQLLNSIDRLILARQRAVLPQLASVPFTIKARDIVALGREPYRYHCAARDDDKIIDKCLQDMEMLAFAQHNYATLSGGEQSRIQIARTLAQIRTNYCDDAPQENDLFGKILFLDEPTNHLDIRHQYRLMETLAKLQRQGLTIVAVMHDLALTLQYAQNIILLKNGSKIGSYTPQQLAASNDLSTTYDIDMLVNWDAQFKRYIVIPQIQ